MRILLVLLAAVLAGVVGFNVNGCAADDTQPSEEQVQDTTDAADTTDTADTTDAAEAAGDVEESTDAATRE